MTTQQRRILESAIVALGRTTGISADVHPAAGRHCEADATIAFETNQSTHRFGAEVKTVDRFATPAMLKARSKTSCEPPLLVAPYITGEVAEHCRQLRVPFIDTAGNAYLEAPGLLVYIVGHARPTELRQGNFRALNAAGLKLTFALLCRPKLLDENYRSIAAAAGVALGTVSADMKDLEARGFFNLETHPHARTLLDPERMLEEWVTHYPVTLRPKLGLGRFRADPERLRQIDLTQFDAYWGGELAADRLTRYLKPGHFTIYTGKPIAKLVGTGRMRAEPEGNLEIMEKFWNFPADQDDVPGLVPPVLIYADLLATREGRNAEAARMIYDRRIARKFDSTK
jgi:hypothetical protein